MLSPAQAAHEGGLGNDVTARGVTHRGNDSLLNAMQFASRGGGTPIIVHTPFCNVRGELGWPMARSYETRSDEVTIWSPIASEKL